MTSPALAPSATPNDAQDRANPKDAGGKIALRSDVLPCAATLTASIFG